MKYGVPALLSCFVPGLGQFIKQHYLRAIIIWAAMAGPWLIVSVVGGYPIIRYAAVGVTFSLWLWQITDAYNTSL